MILFSPNVNSILKAYILSQLYNESPCLKNPGTSGLSLALEERDADVASLSPLLRQLTRYWDRDLGWVSGNKGTALKWGIFFNLRHSARDKLTVIFAAVHEAFTIGPDYCLQGVSDMGKAFVRRIRQVKHEVHRMQGFIRFTPVGETTLVARPKLFHDTGDLILKGFARRYPHHRIVLILENKALAMEKGQIFAVNPADFAPVLAEDTFAGTWEVYYRSQYIESRKNPRLAQKVIPKKFWDWMQEGKFLKKEQE